MIGPHVPLKPSVTVHVEGVQWIGHPPAYLPNDDVYICDARDGAQVRRLIDEGILLLKKRRDDGISA